MNPLLLLLAIPPPPSGRIDFARDVRPILERSCFECHGPALEEASLRLDSRARFLSGGASGKVVAPANAAGSLSFISDRSSGGHTRLTFGRSSA